jgi:hypothetical protein
MARLRLSLLGTFQVSPDGKPLTQFAADKVCARLAEWNLEQGEYERAEGYARRQIELEPHRSPATPGQ